MKKDIIKASTLYVSIYTTFTVKFLNVFEEIIAVTFGAKR